MSYDILDALAIVAVPIVLFIAAVWWLERHP